MGFNLTGFVLPAAAALLAIPLLISGMGEDRFALLTLVWVVAGQASVFDFGIGRALTHTVAGRLGAGRADEVGGVVGTALVLVVTTGTLAGLGLFFGAEALAFDLLNVPAGLEDEARSGFRLLAAALPAITAAPALRGVLEAYQRFDLSNYVRVPLGAFAVLGPLAALLFTSRLDWIVGVLVVGRVLGAAVYLVLLIRAAPAAWPLRLDAGAGRELAQYGGWISGSTLATAALEYASRFMIGVVLPVAAVAHFSAPADLIARVLMVPAALVGVLLPSLSASLAARASESIVLIARSARVIFALMAPVALCIAAFAYEGLSLWISPSFAESAAPSLQLLAVAALLNGVAMVPATTLVSAGRPHLAALPVLVELPLFLAGAWYALQAGYGVAGVAAAYCIRVGIDLVVLAGFCAWTIRETLWPLARVVVATLIATLACLCLSYVVPIGSRPLVLLASVFLGAAATWWGLFDQNDRQGVCKLLGAVWARRLRPRPGSE